MLRNVPHGSRCAALLACPRAPQRLGARPAAPRPGGVPPLVAARPRVTRRPVRDAVHPGPCMERNGPAPAPPLGPRRRFAAGVCRAPRVAVRPSPRSGECGGGRHAARGQAPAVAAAWSGADLEPWRRRWRARILNASAENRVTVYSV